MRRGTGIRASASRTRSRPLAVSTPPSPDAPLAIQRERAAGDPSGGSSRRSAASGCDARTPETAQGRRGGRGRARSRATSPARHRRPRPRVPSAGRRGPSSGRSSARRARQRPSRRRRARGAREARRRPARRIASSRRQGRTRALFGSPSPVRSGCPRGVLRAPSVRLGTAPYGLLDAFLSRISPIALASNLRGGGSNPSRRASFLLASAHLRAPSLRCSLHDTSGCPAGRHRGIFAGSCRARLSRSATTVGSTTATSTRCSRSKLPGRRPREL